MKSRIQAINEIIRRHPGAAFIFGNGLTSREAAALADQPSNFYSLYAMGEAFSIGVGLAAARPDLEVVVVEGDGGTIMGMAGLITRPGIGNLIYYSLCNGIYETVGGTATPTCSWGPEWMWTIEIERGKWGETPDPPPPEFIKRRFQEWLAE